MASDAIRTLTERRTAPSRGLSRRGMRPLWIGRLLSATFVITVGFAAMIGLNAEGTMAWVHTVLGPLGGPSSLLESKVATAEVVVRPGDTLWAIARQYGPANRDIREVIDWIRVHNQLGSRPIRPGEVLVVPTAESGRSAGSSLTDGPPGVRAAAAH